jgi:hypothetical protein
MSEDDDKAREARAASLRSKIDRMTGHAHDAAQPDISGDATADDDGGAGGGAPDEQPLHGEGARSRTAADEKSSAGDKSREGHQSPSGAGESPRDFIQRKMREGDEGKKD